ncbi:transporter substrate-binding domain-containing protein [Pseudodesulfovibrio sp.]|uniref:substrate-binding periplasmic protein n=1 Tax=Pseudodesulfovibrio sp. TaxID=2035812 RepID=UPI002601D5EC|nr:transporter substrate-binding domain-containing protein [Pseudodesulfovibrio sp.]MDD3311855.1 transporter substrate-binding domain-containing protein [Pseudodesulfovibrio sp.]
MHTIRNISISFLIPLLAAVACLLPATPVRAGNGTVVLTVPPEGWAPFVIPAPKQAGRDGILLEVFRTAAKAAGYDCRVEPRAEREGLMLVRQGRADAAPKAKEWVSGPERYLWTDPVFLSTDVVASPKGAPVAYRAPADLKGRTVGLVRGFKYPKLAELVDAGAFTAVRAASVEELLLLLMRGTIECAVVNPTVAKWVLRNRDDIAPGDVVLDRNPVDGAPCRFAFTGGDKWASFVARFNEELAAMKKDGRLAAILNHYQ